MTIQVRVTYKNGVLIPDEPVPLSDGESTNIAFVSRRELIRQEMSDLLEPLSETYISPSKAEIEMAQKRFKEATKGQRSFSEDIIKEREEGW